MSARLVDPAGVAVTGLSVLLCGTDLCWMPQRTASDGSVHFAPHQEFASASFKVLADPTWGAFAALLTGAGPDYSLGDVTVTPLPASGVALDGASGGPATSGGVTLSLAPGTTVTYDILHEDPTSRLFRAAEVVVTGLPVPLSVGVDAAWALAPVDTRLSPAADLVVPNRSQWEAGALVEFFLNGTDSTTSSPAPYGTWGRLGVGAVAADGRTITLRASDGGLPEIGMVGMKLQ